jgi:branched-chain amino acid aminotransferase
MATGPLTFADHRRTDPLADADRAAILADPGFGNYFTDHMVRAVWTPAQGWHDASLMAYGPITLDPSAAVLHYAQEIFEGLKAYKRPDGTIWAFRPEANAARFQRSATRLALPPLAVEDFLESLRVLVAADRSWIPEGAESSLYLRPFMFASEAFLGVRPAAEVTYLLIASPAGAYFSGGVNPVSIWLSTDYNRSGPGGTGAAKCGGNYAASLAPMIEAKQNGCDQVCFLDAAAGRWVEELGGMNIFFVYADGRLVTPELTGTILEGVTRASILALAKELGHEVEERKVSMDEWRTGVADGSLREVFACGTAAVVTPVGRLKWDGGELVMGDGGTGEVTALIRKSLLDIQHGDAPDPHGWMSQLA